MHVLNSYSAWCAVHTSFRNHPWGGMHGLSLPRTRSRGQVTRLMAMLTLFPRSHYSV